LIFSSNSILNISHSKKTSARYHHKCIQVFIWSIRYCCQLLVDLNFLSFLWVFEKSSNTKFHENPSSDSRVVTCGHTWRSKQSLSALLRTHLKTAKKNGKAGPTTTWFSSVIWFVYKQLGKAYPALLINNKQLYSCVCHKSPTCSRTTSCPWRPITIKLTEKYGRR